MLSREEALNHPDQQISNLFAIMQYSPTTFGKYFFPHMFTHPFASFHKHLVKFFLKSKKPIAIAKLPRGFSKTTIVSFLLAIWLAFIFGAKYILLISKTQDKADEMLDDIKAALMHPNFVAIFGNVIGKKWSSDHAHIYCPAWGIDVIIASKSMGTHIRGTKKGAHRIDFAIIDDPENDEEAENPNILTKRVTWVSKVLEPALTENETRGKNKHFYGKIWWLGTPIAEDCVVNRVAKYDDVNLMTYPCIVNTKKMEKELGIKIGRSIWESKFSTEELLAKRQKLILRGEAEVWWSEYMVDPRGTSDITFRGAPTFFTNEDVANKEIPLYMPIDLAYGDARKHDKSAYSVGGFSSDKKLYQFESGRLSKNPELFIKEVGDIIQYYIDIGRPIQKIGIESLAFKMYRTYLKDYLWETLGIYVPIVELKHGSIPKINRIQRLIPFYQDGSYLIKKRFEKLIEQMGRFPSFKGGIDDLDVAAYLLDLAIRPSKEAIPVERKAAVGRDVDRRMKEEAKKAATIRMSRMYGGTRAGRSSRVF